MRSAGEITVTVPRDLIGSLTVREYERLVSRLEELITIDILKSRRRGIIHDTQWELDHVKLIFKVDEWL